MPVVSVVPVTSATTSRRTNVRRTASGLKVGGLTLCSTDALPGRNTAIVFVQGCPWRCGYCHNPHLQMQRPDSPLAWSRIRAAIESRASRLDAILFTGGEPTADPALPVAMGEMRALGLQVGMHTAGTDPDRLQAVLPLLDWVTLDIKAPFSRYARLTGTPGSGDAARACAQAILASGVPYEFRTTFHPALLEESDLEALAHELAALQSQSLTVQRFRAPGCRNRKLRVAGHAASPSDGLLATLHGMFPRFAFAS